MEGAEEILRRGFGRFIRQHHSVLRYDDLYKWFKNLERGNGLEFRGWKYVADGMSYPLLLSLFGDP